LKGRANKRRKEESRLTERIAVGKGASVAFATEGRGAFWQRKNKSRQGGYVETMPRN